MKIMNAKRSVVMIVALLAAITTYAQQSAKDYQLKIESLNKDIAKYMLDGDHEKSLSMYTSDAISMPSNQPMNVGIDAIRKSSEEMAKMNMKVTLFEPKTLKVIPDGKLITEIGTYKFKATMPEMDQPYEEIGKYITIWEKQADGSLKVKVEIWNSDTNPMEHK